MLCKMYSMPSPAGCCPSSGLSCCDWTGELAGLITSMAPPLVLSYRLDDTAGGILIKSDI